MNRQRFIRCGCVLLSILWLSVAAAQNYEGSQADIDQILNNAKAFSAHVVAGNLEGILNSYTEDGKIFPNNRPIMSGRAELIEYWRPNPGYHTTYHLLTPLEIKVTGDEARDHGHYEGRSVGPDGNQRFWQGKYLVIWKKVDGDWKMYLDIWNARPGD